MEASRTPVVELINASGKHFHPAKPGDVGHDLHAVLQGPSTIIWPFQTKTIRTCVRVSQPNDVWCEIVARSSTTRKHLMVFNGIIDSGYQGELFMVLRNLSLIPRVIRHGERYAQAIFHQAVRPIFRGRAIFSETTSRADTGFGSTGK